MAAGEGNKTPLTLELYLEHLRSLRNDWSEEIPEEMLHSDSVPGNPPKVKARNSWFLQISMWYETGFTKGYLPEDFREWYDSFCESFANRDFTQMLTTEGDITEANRHLDRIIEYLENK